MAEAAGPYVVTVGQGFIGPSRSMPDPMVVTAERCQVVDCGGSVLRPSRAVVKIARFGRHPTARKDASRLAGFDMSGLAGVRSPPGRPIVGGVAGFRIGHGPSPFGPVVLFGNLPSDVGDHWPVAG